MGEVFRATDEQLGRLVAVKLLLPSDRDARAAERFHREARAAAMLSDPHVVAVYDFGEYGDGFFLVMELVEGRSVADELAEHGPLPKDRAIDLVEQAAAGLAAAHREDVVHRDVKPSNLLLTADGTVKVADFGIAHLPGEGTTTLTVTGQIIGSTHYLAPERARGGQAGKPADVYALGCVLYQLVTGQPPFTGEVPTSILYQHVDAAPAPPSLIRPELAGPFESVLLQMLAKDAADRPSAAEIAAGALRAQPLGRVVVPATEVLNAGPSTETSPLEAPEQPNRTRRTALLAAGIAVLATAAAVVAAVLLNGDGSRPPTTDVGPQPGATSSTPGPKPASTGTGPTTAPTQSRTANQANPSTQPSQSASQQVTPSTSPSGTASTGTTSPSPSTQSSTTPSVPTQGTPSTGTSPSPPPTDTPTASPSATGTPSPGAQGNATPPASD